MLLASNDSLHSIHFVDAQHRIGGRQRENAALMLARRELEAYFAGQLEEFSVRLAPRGSAFQVKVWEAVRAIPLGETRSYSEIAHSIGAPRAVRAVGGANANNRWPIIVPCHRIVGSSGRLTGYAGGLARKEWLLQHERALCSA